MHGNVLGVSEDSGVARPATGRSLSNRQQRRTGIIFSTAPSASLPIGHHFALRLAHPSRSVLLSSVDHDQNIRIATRVQFSVKKYFASNK